jgi:hypothetical protein
MALGGLCDATARLPVAPRYLAWLLLRVGTCTWLALVSSCAAMLGPVASSRLVVVAMLLRHWLVVVVQVGGGPGGYVAAIKAGQLGLKVRCRFVVLPLLLSVTAAAAAAAAGFHHGCCCLTLLFSWCCCCYSCMSGADRVC